MLSSQQKWTGGFAEYQVLKTGTSILRIPDHIPSPIAATIGCSTATVCAVIEAAGDIRNKVVLINGAGQLGIQAAIMAKHGGAKCVVCVDAQAHRRADAARVGFTCLPPDSLAVMLPDAIDGGAIDVFLELAGTISDFSSLMHHIAVGGTVVFAGAVFPSPSIPLDMEMVIRKCITIKGVHNYRPEHLIHALAFVSANCNVLLSYLKFGCLSSLNDHQSVIQASESGQFHRVGFVGNSRIANVI
jgi:threonine dehydrogenase-like Zn-dependent dehydrogenase